MIEIRVVEGDEYVDLAWPLAEYAFMSSPSTDVPDEKVRAYVRSRRFSTTLLLSEDGRPQATASAHRMTQNVRGRLVEMAGVAGVASRPEARRRGHVRQLTTRLLHDAHADHAATTCLYAFRESFYGRFGYVGLPLMKEATVATAHLAPLLTAEPPGSVEVLAGEEGVPALVELARRVQPGVHGMALRRWYGTPPWSRPRWYAVARDTAGTVTGVLPYRMDLDRGELRGAEMVVASPAGRHQLLAFLARHVDHARVARLPLPAGAFPETWAPDLQVTYKEFQSVSAMARVLSVPGLQGIAVGPAEVTVAVRDPLVEDNDTVWTLRGEDGGLGVTRGGTAECVLPIDGLTALVFGGYDPDDLYLRGWGDPPEEVRQRLRTLLPPVVPNLYELF